MALTKVPSNLDATIATTQSQGNNSTNIATTAYVDLAVSNLSDSAPAALNTLNEIAAALGDDANYASTTTAAIATKLPLAGGTMTGNLTVNAIVDADNFKINGGQGSDGQLLTSTGSGVAWEDAPASGLPLAGGTMTGNIVMGDNNITGINKLEILDSADNNRLEIYGNASNGFIFDMGGTGSTGTINFNDFNVGIGTSSPTSPLHVESSTVNQNTVLVKNTAGTGVNYGLEIAAGTNATDHALQVLNAAGTSMLRVTGGGNVGIGETTPLGKLHVKEGDSGQGSINSNFDQLVLEDDAHSGMTILSGTSSDGGIYFGDSGGNNLGQFKYKHGSNSFTFATNNGNESLIIDASGNVGIGTTDPKSTLQIEGGRMGIISTSSSWEQLRIANSSVAEAGIAIMNGCTASEFLADNSPSFSNAFTLAINPYGCGTDTLGIAHGNLTDSIWHIDGSGNFGYGPNTENPVSYYEISKTRPNVNQPSDYELKMTLNTYGYVASNYKLGMLQFVGGDTAGAQDNFYAGIGSTALDGTNNSEEGSLDFHVRNGASSTETLAVQIVGKAGTPLAGGGQVAKSTLFRYQGLAIDRVWGNYPGFSVLNSSDAGTNQGEFRFHGTNSSSATYPAASGADFSVNVRTDGSFISTSDGRAKTNITTIDNALSKVNQLTGKRFQRINRENTPQEHLSKNGYKFGFIAQEIEDIIPEAVQYHADEDDGTENWNSSYAMDYGSVVALLVNAIKEQDVVIQDLKTRITTLEG